MQTTNNKLTLSFDLRIIVGVLLAIIVGMLVIWMPWQAEVNSDQVIRVTGETVVKAEPDEYIFYPSYPFKNADKDVALQQVTAKTEEVINKLKELGVPESGIKNSSSGYNLWGRPETDDEVSYVFSPVITVDSKDLAQKVQDYLVTTNPEGMVTPQATFSEAKKKELETRARDEATKDARAKADQSANNLGFKVGKVKSVEDGSGFVGAVPLDLKANTAQGSLRDMSATTSSLPVNPGENEINYSVTVTYFVR